jgi:hypothetical protein
LVCVKLADYRLSFINIAITFLFLVRINTSPIVTPASAKLVKLCAFGSFARIGWVENTPGPFPGPFTAYDFEIVESINKMAPFTICFIAGGIFNILWAR